VNESIVAGTARQMQGKEELLRDVSVRLLTATEPQLIIDELATRTMEHIGCEYFFNYLVDRECNCLHLNAFSGISEEEAKGMRRLDFGSAVCGRVAQSGKRAILANIDKDNEERAAFVRSQGVRAYACHPLLADGVVIGTLSFGMKSRSHFEPEEIELMREVSSLISIALKRVMEKDALAEQEERYRLLVQYAPTAIYEIDFRGPRFRSVNDAMCHMSGYSREELLAINPMDVLVGDSKARFLSRAREMLAGGNINNSVEYTVTKKDGTLLSVVLNIKPIYEGGNPIGALVIGQDITERKKVEEKVVNLKTRFEMAQRAAGVGVWDWDIGSGKLDWTDEMFRLFDIEPGPHNASFENFLAAIHPDDRDLANKKIMQALNDHAFLENEYRVIRHDGEYWVQALGQGEYDTLGNPVRMTGICQDITKRKSIEKALLDSQRKFQALIETNLDFFWETDAQGRYTYCSPQMQSLWGLDPEGMLGRTLFEVMPSQAKEEGTKLFSEIAAAARPFTGLKFSSIDDEGNPIVVEISGVPFFDDNGVFMGFRGMTRDITMNKSREDAQDFLLKMSDTLRPMDDPEAVMNTADHLIGEHLGANRVFFIFVDREDDRLSTGTYFVRDEGGVQKGFLNFKVGSSGYEDLRRGKPIVIDDRTHADPPLEEEGGSLVQQKGSIIYIPIIKEEQLVGLLAISHNKRHIWKPLDIYLAEEAARRIWTSVERTRAVRVIRESEHRLKIMNEELKRSNSELQQFAYIASHDLREPLRMVASYLELLQHKYEGKVLDERAKEYIRYAVDGSARMQQLIDDVLTYSRVDTKGKALSNVRLDDVISVVLEDLGESIERSEAIIEIPPLPEVVADQNQMVLLFENLIGNSIKFHGAERPLIVIACKKGDNEWTVSITDNGIGIPPEKADKLFHMFSRLHTRDEYPGTGIGLAICKKIVERHGGRIWVEATKSKGATFKFTIPIWGNKYGAYF